MVCGLQFWQISQSNAQCSSGLPPHRMSSSTPPQAVPPKVRTWPAVFNPQLLGQQSSSPKPISPRAVPKSKALPGQKPRVSRRRNDAKKGRQTDAVWQDENKNPSEREGHLQALKNPKAYAVDRQDQRRALQAYKLESVSSLIVITPELAIDASRTPYSHNALNFPPPSVVRSWKRAGGGVAAACRTNRIGSGWVVELKPQEP
jgi:hypothetical protein